jgi:hypothetical protein
MPLPGLVALIAGAVQRAKAGWSIFAPDSRFFPRANGGQDAFLVSFGRLAQVLEGNEVQEKLIAQLSPGKHFRVWRCFKDPVQCNVEYTCPSKPTILDIIPQIWYYKYDFEKLMDVVDSQKDVAVQRDLVAVWARADSDALLQYIVSYFQEFAASNKNSFC